MATISDLIKNIVRVDISDDVGSRFTDTQLLTFFKQAIRRAQVVGYQNRLQFMRKKVDFNQLANQAEYALPSDFAVQHSLWVKGTGEEIRLLTVEEFETGDFEPLEGYLFDGSNIVFADPPTETTAIRLYYFVDSLANSLTLSSSTPWNGKLDFAICEYVNLRAFHVDRYDLSVDFSLLKDMEKSILGMYQNLEPTMEEYQGAFDL